MRKSVRTIVLLFAAVLACGSVLGACGSGSGNSRNQAREDLVKSIETLKRDLPVNMGMAGYLTGMNYDQDNNLVKIIFTVDAENIPFEFMDRNREIMKPILLSALSAPKMKEFSGNMADAEVGIRYVFKSTGGEDAVIVSVSDKELKEALENPVETSELNEAIVKYNVAATNNAAPVWVDDISCVSAAEDDGENVVYITMVDDEVVDFQDIAVEIDALREYHEMSFGDRVMKVFLDALCGTGRGLIYRYVSKSGGESFEIGFTPQQLQSLIYKGN